MSASSAWMRLRILATLCCAPFHLCAHATGEVRLFPVKAFFHDDSAQSTLDPMFLTACAHAGTPAIASEVNDTLLSTFKDSVGSMDGYTAGRTFAVSFHASRATSYLVNKGNGNSDLVISATASLYFTNVLSGDILSTITKTVVNRMVVANSAATEINARKAELFERALHRLIAELATEAGNTFHPSVVNARVIAIRNGLAVLDTGYRGGIQEGDQISDNTGQLLAVLYSSDTYSVAQPVLADQLSTGQSFQKYISHQADGKVRPRTVVFLESLPAGFSKEYLTQQFSDIVGDKAPLSIVQVNPGFRTLIHTVTQQASLSSHDVARRRLPELFIRLRIAEPIYYEARTNLPFSTIRHYETLAFADVVDTSGRINFSAVGKDVIEDSITNGVGPGFFERSEVNIKNALLDLAVQMGKLSEPHREQFSVQYPLDDQASIQTKGKALPAEQPGVVLTKTELKVDNKSMTVWLPMMEAFVAGSGASDLAPLRKGLPIDASYHGTPTRTGDIFEIQRLGPTPRSFQAFVLCPQIEHLGGIATPSLIELASQALGNKMPGMFYAPSLVDGTSDLLTPSSGFSATMKWQLPLINTCG